MQVAAMLLTAVVAVPPGEQVVEHTQPWHGGQPVVRRFERREDDEVRRRAWIAFCLDLDDPWAEYRAAGSTPRAWRRYQDAVGQVRRDYVYRDRYLVPVVVDRNRRDGP